MPIPDFYQGTPLMRIEARLKRNPAKYLNQAKPLLAERLYSNEGYHAMLNYWLSSYHSIQKLNPIAIDFDGIKSPKDANNMLFASLLGKNGGEEEINHFIQELKAKQCFTYPNEYTRCKKGLTKLLHQARKTETSDLISELNTRVDEFADQVFNSIIP